MNGPVSLHPIAPRDRAALAARQTRTPHQSLSYTFQVTGARDD